MEGKFILNDGTLLSGRSFGFPKSVAGEVVFSTGMVGYPESLTDPSYFGQILVFTYPLIGNYGVPDKKHWESNGIKVAGLIVSGYVGTPSHFQSQMTLANWLKLEKIPALEVKDTRLLAKKIREQGTMLGKLVIRKDVDFYDPDKKNLVSLVSTKTVIKEGKGAKTIVILDCGTKRSIKHCFLKRGVRIITIPWDCNPFSNGLDFDAIVISNGPGDPKHVGETIKTVTLAMKEKIPILGICLGSQILALAAGGDTYKMKFGHRSQNQPCLLVGTSSCYITTQNHGFAVGKIPQSFKPWFTNANDNTNEGIIHEKLPFMSVQFHPEANPGPVDTEWIFDYFMKRL